MTAILLVMVAVGSSCGEGATDSSAVPPSTAAKRNGTEVVSHTLRSAFPEGSTPESVLRDIVKPPNVLGFVRGTVVSGGVGVEVREGADPRLVVGFTDYRLRVTSFAGPGSPPYRIGSEIQLRVPGGTVDGRTYIEEDGFAPFSVGQSVYVLVRDQGVRGGGNTAERLVASIPGQDIFYVDETGKVRGEGFFERFVDTPTHFESRFKAA